MSKLRIHYLYFDYRNVIPIHSYEVIGQLARQGCDVTVFGAFNRDFAHRKEWEQFGIAMRPVASIPLPMAMEISFLIALIMELAGEWLRKKPDLIYVRHASLSMFAVLWGKLMRCPVYLEVNDIQTKRITFKGIRYLKKVWIEVYEWISFRAAYKIFPVTDGITNWVCKRYGREAKDVVTVANGVNIERFRAGSARESREKFAIPQDRLVVTYLGSLFPWSGIECLIDAVPAVSAIHPKVFFAVGGGEEPDCGRLTEKARIGGLSNSIRFFGRIDWRDASDFINAAHACVAPARFGNTETGIASQKVLAYLSCAKPVVGSDIPGLGDMLERESVGVSFRMGDPASLAESLVSLLSQPHKIGPMGQRGRDLVERSYSWQKIAQGLITQFRDDLRMVEQ